MRIITFGLLGVLSILSQINLANAADECPKIPDLQTLTPDQQNKAVMQYEMDYDLYCSGNTLGEVSCEGVTSILGILTIDFCTPASVKCPKNGTDTTACKRKLFPNGRSAPRSASTVAPPKAISNLNKLIQVAQNLITLFITINDRNKLSSQSMHSVIDPIIKKSNGRPLTATENTKIDNKITQVQAQFEARHNSGLRALADFNRLLGKDDGTYVKGDFYKDGKLDYLLINPANGVIDVWIRGADRFVRSQSLYLNAKSVSLFDSNQDGNIDLLIQRRTGDSISIPGNGKGLFLICANPSSCR